MEDTLRAPARSQVQVPPMSHDGSYNERWHTDRLHQFQIQYGQLLSHACVGVGPQHVKQESHDDLFHLDSGSICTRLYAATLSFRLEPLKYRKRRLHPTPDTVTLLYGCRTGEQSSKVPWGIYHTATTVTNKTPLQGPETPNPHPALPTRPTRPHPHECVMSASFARTNVPSSPRYHMDQTLTTHAPHPTICANICVMA
jgi:hypothetical protein